MQVDGAVEDEATSPPAAAAESPPPVKVASEPKKRKKTRGPVRGKIGDYNILGMIGRGSFSRVFKCVYVPTDKEYAMKVMSKRCISKKEISSNIRREIAIMKKLDHPHVVVMREALQSATELFLVLDLVEGGTVREALIQRVPGRRRIKLKFEESRAKRYMLQLFDGLGYCHSRGVCHRELKPENLMLDLSDNLKITDFSSATMFDAKRQRLLYTRDGTSYYLAPEVIARTEYEGEKADIWSCGVIAFRMLAGRVPFQADSTVALYYLIRHASYDMPDTLSEEAQELLQKLLVANPSERITLQKAIALPWFAELEKTTRKLTHEKDTLAPSDHSIATAIKPLSRQQNFEMSPDRRFDFQIALKKAAKAGNIQKVQELIDAGKYPPDEKHLGNGRTALAEAAFYGRLEIVHLLLQHGARARHQDKNGKTALDYATLSKRKKVIDLLRQKEKEEEIEKNAVRQWCRIFATAELFLANATGEQKTLLKFFVEYPGLRRLVGGILVRFYNPIKKRKPNECVVM